MKKCEAGDECIPCCDFCKYYDFNGDDEGRYTGDGYCRKHKIAQEPYAECDEFICFKAQ